MNWDKPILIFRRTKENRYTIPTLLGGLEETNWSRKMHILLAESLEEINKHICPKITLVAYSFLTPYLAKVQAEVETLRKDFKEKIIIIAGGPHATADPKGTFKLGFDFVFQGEAEETFPRFLQQYFRGKLPTESIISAVSGPGQRPSFPPYSLAHNFFAPLEISRGCLYGCTFCQTPRLFGNSLRHRSLPNLFYHLKRAASLGYRRCSFISPNALAYGAQDSSQPNLAILEEMLALCKEAGYTKINFGSFPSEVRPDWVSAEALELIKKLCHNRTIVLGVQSGSNDLLQKLHRGHTAEQALEAVKLVYKSGFIPHVDFVFGFPEETNNDRLLSLRLAAKMIRQYGAKIHAHTFLPLPGTPLFNKEPSPVDGETKNVLLGWERERRLDGWWKEQEFLAREIIRWRDQGIISTN